MELYSKGNYYKLYQGSMLDLLEIIEPNTIDSIVTDPPYELNFMNKGWDNAGVSFNNETWKKCLDVLKPGGYLLAFGGSRTFHRIACAIEDAGFEIRDTICYLYGSGFPKSMNIGLAIDKKNGIDNRTGNIAQGAGSNNTNSMNCGNGKSQEFKHFYEERKAQNKWEGWGTALKPSYEPIIVARKPFKGSCVDNVIKYGVGGINIDECRVGVEVIKGGTMPDFRDIGQKSKDAIGIDKLSFGQVENAKRKPLEDHTGRFPANTILSYDEDTYDEVCGGFPNSIGCKPHKITSSIKKYEGYGSITQKNGELVGYDDNGGSASRYFYCAKASKKDRNEGLDENERNDHPTVKNTELMQYLVRLVTPNGGTILDPFNGSGSTGKAVMYENLEKDKDYHYIGIDLEEHYLDISNKRIKFVEDKINQKENESTQITFDM